MLSRVRGGSFPTAKSWENSMTIVHSSRIHVTFVGLSVFSLHFQWQNGIGNIFVFQGFFFFLMI